MGLLSTGQRKRRRRRDAETVADVVAGLLTGVACAALFLVYFTITGTGPALLFGSDVDQGASRAAAAAADADARSNVAAIVRAAASAPPIDLTAAKNVAEAVSMTASAAADAIDALMDVDALPHLLLSYGNAAYFNFVHNWAIAVRQIGAPFVIAAFDDAMLGQCADAGLPCVRAQFTTPDNFRADFEAFRVMGAVKVRLALEILERRPRLPLLVVSDSDTVWLRQPWDYFAQRPTADFFVSSDCLSHRMEDEWQPQHSKSLCGHVPGNDGVAFNTGLFAARNSTAARAFMRAWFEMLTDSGKVRHSDPEHRGIDDQLALNLLFDPGMVSAVGPDEPRLISVCNGSLRLQTLPVALFPGGHVAFVQRLPWRLGVEPIVIHMTWQRWGVAGKVARLREFGLWHMDPPEYYGAGFHNNSAAFLRYGGDDRLWLLAYENRVREFVARVAAERYPGGAMPLLYKHWLGMSYQLAAFREALAAARMLGRTLVLPTLWCWCDYDEVPNSGILDTCLINAGDYASPFRCPLDFLLPIEVLDRHNVSYRAPGFLDLPQVPPEVRASRTVLDIADIQPNDPDPEGATSLGAAGTAWTGMPEFALPLVEANVGRTYVLELRGELPGLLLSWDEASDAKAFDALFEAVLGEAFWCCFTWGDHDEEYRVLFYAAPEPYANNATTYVPWTVPVLTLPDWCDKVSTADDNDKFTRMPQHPCAFLRNPEAARLAAAGGQATPG